MEVHLVHAVRSEAYHALSIAVCKCYLRTMSRGCTPISLPLPHKFAPARLTGLRWKSTVEKKLQVLEDSVGKLNQLAAVGGHDSRFLPSLATASTRLNALAPATDQTPPQRSEQAWEVVMDLNQGPGVVPASVVSEVPAAGGDAIAPNQRQPVDLIDQGVISLTDAQEFFDLYYRRLDHFLYRILAEHDSLASIRKSSSLLTAAVCTVGALHQSSPQYQPCYQHFVQLASSQMFSKKNNHDDVRALCIGAFWLSDISWSLLGQGM